MPVTPVDTPTGSKRKRAPEVQDLSKRARHASDDRFEEEGDDGEIPEQPAVSRSVDAVGFEDDSLFLDEYDEFDSGDEEEGEDDDAEGEHEYNYSLYNPVIRASRTQRQDYGGDEDDADEVEYDYNVYNPIIRAPWLLERQRQAQEAALARGQDDEATAEKIQDYEAYVNDTQEDPFYHMQPDVFTSSHFADDVFDAAPANDDEERVVFEDVDDSDVESTKGYGDETVFEPSLFEDAEGEESIFADIRARVGSLEDDFVSKQFLLDRGWTEDSVWLVQRLHQRGHEPIFPQYWQLDFPYLPDGLFLPAKHPAQAHFRSLRGQDFRATNALSRLILLGPKVRDKITVGKAPEPLIVKELRRYMLWADYDASNQYPTYPLTEIYAAGKDADVQAMQDELLRRLAQLYRRWRRATTSPSSTPRTPTTPVSPGSPSFPIPQPPNTFSTPPTLYGVLVSHTLIGIVTFVPGSGDGGGGGDSIGYLRSVGVFDFGISDYDVWNSLALALLTVHARDRAVERGVSVPRPGRGDRWAVRVEDPDA